MARMQSSKLKAALSWRMLVQFFFGISSGLPYMMIGSTLQAWMTDEKIDLKTIGFFSLVSLPFTFKFVWAPLMDRYVPKFLDRRRSWILLTQLALALCVAVLSSLTPVDNMKLVAFLALLIAFFSASQDIVLDAYRRETLGTDELALGTSLFVNGYRIAMLISGALALMLADRIPWKFVYLILGSFFLMATMITLVAPNLLESVAPPRSLKEAVFNPLIEYFKRKGALEILLFILLYKLGDQLAATMATPFYLNLGFTKTQIGAIAKTFGFGATISGLLAGGILGLKVGMRRSLLGFGVLQAISILGFAVLAHIGQNLAALTIVIALDNFASGMGTSAFLAYMASLTNKKFTATQYALLTSLMRIPGVVFGSSTGILAESLGWANFFVFCTLAAVPGLLLLTLRFHRWHEDKK